MKYPQRVLTKSGISYGLSNASTLEDEPFSHASLASLSPKITGIRSAVADGRYVGEKDKYRYDLGRNISLQSRTSTVIRHNKSRYLLFES